ncbi:MAG: HAD family phosphatase [Flavobacteriales bacterium]|nr:HAD family phosphatase [Flavobacteriales bacterium]
MGSSKVKDVQLVIFDLGGVILDIEYQRTQDAFSQLGIKDVDTLYSQASQTSLFDDLETGRISPQAFRSGLRTLAGVSLSDEAIDKAWNALLLDLPIERLGFIQRVKKRYKTCLLSNTNEIHILSFEHRLEERGILEIYRTCFDEVLYSSRIGKRKPDEEVFRYVLELFQIPGEKALFIDDSPQHIEGAASLGIHTVFLDKGEEMQERLAHLIS